MPSRVYCFISVARFLEGALVYQCVRSKYLNGGVKIIVCSLFTHNRKDVKFHLTCIPCSLPLRLCYVAEPQQGGERSSHVFILIAMALHIGPSALLHSSLSEHWLSPLCVLILLLGQGPGSSSFLLLPSSFSWPPPPVSPVHRALPSASDTLRPPVPSVIPCSNPAASWNLPSYLSAFHHTP